MRRCRSRFGQVAATTAIALAVAASLPVVAFAGPRDDLAEAARAFDEAALRNNDDNTRQSGPRKWMGPIRIAVRNPGQAPSLVQPTIDAIRAIAQVARLEVSVVDIGDASANFVIFFDENETSGKISCVAWARYKGWAISGADIKINPGLRGRILNCIVHEALHAFGFMSHPHAGDSVLSYVYQRTALTGLDVNLIKTLYDPEMKPGIAPLKASLQGCRILARLMSATAADEQEVCSVGRRAERSQGGESFTIGTASLARTAGTCGERVVYWVNRYPDKVALGFVDEWRSFTAAGDGSFGGSFTVQTKPKPLDFKLSGNLRSGQVEVENLTQACAWKGSIE